MQSAVTHSIYCDPILRDSLQSSVIFPRNVFQGHHHLLFAKALSCLMLFTLDGPFLIHRILLIRNFRGLFLIFLYPLFVSFLFHLLHIISLNTALINHVSKGTNFLQGGFLLSVAHSLFPLLVFSDFVCSCFSSRLIGHSSIPFVTSCSSAKFQHPLEYKQNKLFRKVHNCVGYEGWH